MSVAIREDYIMRQIIMLAEFIRKALSVRHIKKDPLFLGSTSAVLEEATSMDAQTLLRMDPSSLAMMLELAQVSDKVGGWIVAAVELEEEYYHDVGDEELADLRNRQSAVLRKTFLVEESLEEILNEAKRLGEEDTDQPIPSDDPNMPERRGI